MEKHQAVSSRKKAVAGIGLLALSAFAVTGCGEQTKSTENTEIAEAITSLTIQASYKDRSILRPGSQLIVTLSNVSKMDVKADIITQEVIDINQASPFTVELVYDANKISDKHHYSLSARIINKDKVLYTSTINHDPFTDSQLTDPYKIELSKVSTQKPDVTLTNTYWKAITINAQTVNVTTKEPFIQFDKDYRVNGFLGCNNFSGSYSTEQHTITLSQLASTKKMCSENMDQEAAMSNVLNNTSKWEITGESLKLKNNSGNTLATFNAVYFN